MKKLVLLVLLSVMSVGMVAESSHAFIFGGGAWRRHYRRSGAGFFRGRSVSVEKRGPYELEYVRVAVDSQIKRWKFLGLPEGASFVPGSNATGYFHKDYDEEEEDPFREYK